MIDDYHYQQTTCFGVCDNAKIVAEVNKDCNTDFSHFDAALQDIERLFAGAGFRRCNTAYHDLRHTMMVMLAMIRLMHGASLQGIISRTRKLIWGSSVP